MEGGGVERTRGAGNGRERDGWVRDGSRLYAVRLVRPGANRSERRDEIASVWADSLSEAIAIALRRYPGCLAVHGERH